MLTDERYKQLMQNVGMPNSISLLQALKQAVMEAILKERERWDWQPIETAPKDGTHVLLWRDDIQFTGYFSDSGWCVNAPNLPRMLPSPTHWMPLLPKPPEANHG